VNGKIAVAWYLSKVVETSNHRASDADEHCAVKQRSLVRIQII